MNHLIAFFAGWLADLILGDPAWLPHPVVGFGKLIAKGEKRWNNGENRRRKGRRLTLGLVIGSFLVTIALLLGMRALSEALHIGHTLQYVSEAILVFFCLAGTTLIREVREVFRAVDRSLEEGRKQVARIVGRDTSDLSAQEIRTAALETLAENLNDGVIAPLFWLTLLGVPGMVAYKMINTLDSMIGYRNERYLEFGRFAARLDDAAGWIPARITAFLMLLVAGRLRLLPFVRKYGPQHLSPNSGWPEAALAALLDCRFGGPHNYFGEEVWKPYIGENDRPLTSADMERAVRVNRGSEIVMVLVRAAILLGSMLLTFGILNAAPKLEVIHSGERTWELLLADMEQASSSICLEYYHFADDMSGREVRDVLVRKAGEGIPVRLIVENVVHGFSAKHFFTEMEKSGIEVRYFTDLHRWDALSGINRRDHRKIAVIDSRIGYLGGMNLDDDSHYRWSDTHLRFESPAAIQLERIFYRMWTALGGTGAPEESLVPRQDDGIEIIAGGPAYPVFAKKYLQALQEARTYAYFETPYFCPPDTLVSALKMAASRGVDVRIIVPDKTDHSYMDIANQFYFPELLEAGIRIYAYLPRFDHSKVFLCDDAQCWIGSVNLDNRSLYLNYEVCACIYDAETTLTQRNFFLGLLEECREVSLTEAARQAKDHRFQERLIRLLKPQL